MQEEVPVIEQPRELVRQAEVRPHNNDVQQAVKGLKTSHENHDNRNNRSNVNNPSDPIVLDPYESAPPSPGPSYQPTPIHHPRKPVPIMTPKTSNLTPLDTSTPLMVEKAVKIKDDLDVTSSEPEENTIETEVPEGGEENQFCLTRGEIMGHFRTLEQKSKKWRFYKARRDNQHATARGV